MTGQPQRPRRILFALASPEYLRYYDSTLRLLADRGHTVLLAVNQLRERKQARLQLLDDARVTVVGVVPERGDVWQGFARGLRGTMDFVRYLHPRFADTPLLRQRMYRKYLPWLMQPLDRFRSLNEAWLGRTIGLLQAAERAVPVSDRVLAFLAAHRPDIVVLSPLIDGASDQVDLLRAAQSIGVPVVAAIASWDNLTNKGLMRVEPDLVTVWNGHQKAEAVAFHGVRAERIAVTGAQPFDRWFEREVSKQRREFCAAVGLPDERPFVLFTGSSVFIARSEFEVPFVRQWIEALRASSDPALRDLAVLVRPHPFNPEAWIAADFSDLGPVAIWPRRRYTPASEDARDSFFDSLWHSDAVVGINTSAMIEAAILRKPVLSLLTPQFAGTQEGTLHFRYLLPEHGGFLRVANSIEAHVEQLRDVLANPEATRQQTEQFVGHFLRPHGLATPCTPLLANAIESAGVHRHAEPDRVRARVIRLLLWPIVLVSDGLSRHGERQAKWLRSARRAPTVVSRWIKRGYRATRRGEKTFRQRSVKRTRHLLRQMMRTSPAASIAAARKFWKRQAQRSRRAVQAIARGLQPRQRIHRLRASVASGRVHLGRWIARRRRDARHALGPLKRLRSRIRLRSRVRLIVDRVRQMVSADQKVVHRGTSRQSEPRQGRRALAELRLVPLRWWRQARSKARRARYDFGVWRRGAPASPRAASERPERSLRILFAIRNFIFLRLFEPVVRELAARGHDVHLLADCSEQKSFSDEERRALEVLETEFPNVTHSWAPRDIEDDWVDLRLFVRYGLDYLRFVSDAYRDSPILAARAVGRTPKAIVDWSQRLFWRSRAGRWLMTAGLRAVERTIPVDAVLEHSLMAGQPDVLLVTPLIWLGSEQQDMIRVARRYGVPSALCVASWDNLSSKALVRTVPDRVFVWNDVQRAEAVQYHRVPATRVVVTGAQCFDRWFGRTPTRDRETFCHHIGLDPARPIVVYTCSALFEGTPVEMPFVARWLEAVRAHDDPVLRHANILIRPHPRRSGEWQDVDPIAAYGAVVWPPRGVTPLDADTRADYFDSLYHATAVVGLNTTAMIEAGVIGRPVHTVLLPEFRDNQEGTLHFRYLLDGGLVVAARDLDTHLRSLAASLVPAAEHPHLRAFVEQFVRPRGLDVAATPLFVGEVEALGHYAPAPQRERAWARVGRRLLEPTALSMVGTFSEPAARERNKLNAARTRAQRDEERRQERERLLAERQASREAIRSTLEIEKRRQREEKAAQQAARRLAHEIEREARRSALEIEKQRRREEKAAQQAARRLVQEARRQAIRSALEAEKARRQEAAVARRAAQRMARNVEKAPEREARLAAHRLEKARRRKAERASKAS